MTKVKICGITNLEDALLSAKFGADALGFNFYAKSPRYILPETAREIIEQLPGNILKVGVFVNESLEKIVEIAETAKLNALQLHGEETPEFAKELKEKTDLEIIKAFRVSPTFKPEDVLQYEVDAILLDAYNPKEHGGTGETFDWEIARKVQEIFPKMYLAGGLTHENIIAAIKKLSPFAVDTCSGVESNKGEKDKVKLINFIAKVKRYLDFEQRLENNKTQKFQSLYDLLLMIHCRPQMYLGEKSLSKLWIFMEGFTWALHLADANFDVGKYDSKEF
ncbi:MAG: phosphoribosylanthranilate isomerase, partial [Blastocatellia bacterium]|nr:phosphoribosylanthranilate isomerase [Blastocatellia bacterium]